MRSDFRVPNERRSGYGGKPISAAFAKRFPTYPASDPLPEATMEAFRRAVESYFQPLSNEIGTIWQVVCPWIAGFSTPTIQVTIGVYHGHFPSVCVKLRPNSPPASLGSDEGAFGLGWVQEFVSGRQPLHNPTPRWQPDTITAEVEKLAGQFRQFALPLILSPGTDWFQIQRFVRAGVEREMSPAHQSVEPGKAGDFVAFFVVEGSASWIAIELSQPLLKSGRIERWAPEFTCDIPPELQAAIDAAAPAAISYKFWFRGIPSEKGRFGSNGQCLRKVSIRHVSLSFDGHFPTSE